MSLIKAVVGWKPFSDDPNVASARLRCRVPLALLGEQGFPVELYREKNRRNYRVVILQKLYDREHQELARQLRAQGTQVVFDLCDNYLYAPDRDAAGMERAEQVRRMLGMADVVTVPTAALAERLPRPATVIRDGVEPCPPRGLPWPPLAGWLRKSRLELIWFGTWGGPHASFGMRDLLGIAGTLRGLASRVPVRLTVVSNSRRAYAEWIAPLALPTRYLNWKSHVNLCRLLPLHDICLLPIQPNPYTVCKSPNRLALSLSLGVPVVATGIPSYEEFGPFCILDDWENGLREIKVRSEHWRARAEAGRTYVQEHHTAEHAAAEWQRLLSCLLSPASVGMA